MGIGSSIWNFFRAVLKKIFSWVADFIKRFWIIILIVLIIWFAPQIAVMLAEAGAPVFMVEAMTFVATNVTPFLVSWGTWIAEGIAHVGTQAAIWYNGLGFQAKFLIAWGAAALIAPEETAELTQEVLEKVIEIATPILETVTDAVTDVLFNTPLGLGFVAFGLVWLLAGRGRPGDPHTKGGAV